MIHVGWLLRISLRVALLKSLLFLANLRTAGIFSALARQGQSLPELLIKNYSLIMYNARRPAQRLIHHVCPACALWVWVFIMKGGAHEQM